MLGQRSRRVILRPLKGKRINQQAWPTRAMARRAVVYDIASYNGTRLHSTLSYRTPNE
jgi:hypothetical protein